MNVFCYLMYKTPKGKTGTFRVKVDSHKLKDVFQQVNNLPINEHGEACNEFAKCLGLLDSDQHLSRIFENSVLSHEVMSYYLLAGSATVKDLIGRMQVPALHCVYAFNAHIQTKHVIKEDIYPGPDQFAPEEALNKWLSTAFS